MLEKPNRNFFNIENARNLPPLQLAVNSSIEDGPYLETAHEADTKMVMGIQHPNAHIHGIQFHPESVGSKEGLELLKNFLALEADA